MLQPAFPALDILAKLPPGGLLLTPNNRLRNRCQQVFAAQQPPGGSWVPPPVESLSGWLDKLWDDLQQRGWKPAMKRLLNREQRELLWQRALDEALERPLLNAPQLCRDADNALAQLLQWQLVDDIEQLDTALDPLLERFALTLNKDQYPLFAMIRSFARQLHNHQAITPDQRDQLILLALREHVLQPLPRIDTAGFAQMPPLAAAIIHSAADKVVKHQSSQRRAEIRRAPCRDLEDELYQAARWAAQKLAHSPNASVGIVVNNLGQCRAQVEAVFARVLEPQFLSPAQHRYTLPFNFSAGTPLAQTPVGSAALQLLELLRDDWDCTQLRNLLFNPFWHTPDEAETDGLWLRSAVFRRLQQLELRRIDGATLRYWAERTAEKLGLETAQLPRQLEQIGDRQRRWQRAPAEIWAVRFSEVLAILGWPGCRNPDSQEYQQLQQWESALEDLAALSEFAGSLSLAQALQQLRQIASRTPFQAETRDGPLQILGVLEAGGLAFDHLRLVGFGQQQWPPVPNPNPLLPIQWQKHWKMPRATAERELELATELTADLLNASPEIVVSYACEEDGVAQELSPLFGKLETAGPVDGDPLSTHCEQLAAAVALEKITDDRLPPLTPADCRRVRGGASVLQAQARCPLNAQLRHRLGAVEFQLPDIGPSPAERGNIVHQVLAEFWQQCGDSVRLQSVDSEARQGIIDAAIDRSLRGVRKKHGQLPAGFWDMEKQRLQRLLQQWLQLEAARSAFAVENIEWEQQVEIGGLKFSLRLDRLDQLASGEQLVIDYKTGQPNINDWLSERIREPQLPLYALTQPKARAIAFAQVRTNDCKWNGCGDLQDPIDGIKAVVDTQKDAPYSTWQELNDRWRQSLQMLAEEYRSGTATLIFDRPADNDPQLWPLNRWPEREQDR
ncbi:PD-(D/E)XK nuclease family protein [Microbulbifer thermotolerans]|uniref:PD-(D/E)XK nuclease family protein n=1 Tax=Microbulbifer thermotolerans TaxID=252514 RepID=UPI0026735872|nr:PD-(D/E)XK nuclease family protein [Microbulbifer thermotolerans]WKT62110.1 PD-(D/E)XK nuclease family protein [Microbulbifer thermotolerans]